MKLHDYEAEQVAKLEKTEKATTTYPYREPYLSGAGSGAKSLICYRKVHKTEDCIYTWCDCDCHKAESQQQRIDRALGRMRLSAIVEAAKELK